MLKYVKTLLIGKSTGANTGTSLQTMVAGDILFVNADTQAVLSAADLAAYPNHKPILIAMGLGAGLPPRLSSPIKRREVRLFIREPYRAATAQVDTITTAMVAGKEYRLTVVLKDEFRVISMRQTKLEIIYVATGTPGTDVANLVRMVNKNRATRSLIVASAGGTAGDLVLTGQLVPTESIDDYQIVAFNTVFVETDPTQLTNPTLSGGTPRTVVTNSKPNPGSGVYAQLKQTERELSGYLGNNDLTSYDRPGLQSRLDPNGTYDLIDIQWLDKHQGDHEFSMESPVGVTIATVSGSALSTFVETQLKAFYNKDAAATPGSAGDDPDQVGGE